MRAGRRDATLCWVGWEGEDAIGIGGLVLKKGNWNNPRLARSSLDLRERRRPARRRHRRTGINDARAHAGADTGIQRGVGLVPTQEQGRDERGEGERLGRTIGAGAGAGAGDEQGWDGGRGGGGDRPGERVIRAGKGCGAPRDEHRRGARCGRPARGRHGGRAVPALARERGAEARGEDRILRIQLPLPRVHVQLTRLERALTERLRYAALNLGGEAQGCARRGVWTYDVRARGRHHGSAAGCTSPHAPSDSDSKGRSTFGKGTNDAAAGKSSGEAWGEAVTLASETVRVGGDFREEEVYDDAGLGPVGRVDKGAFQGGVQRGGDRHSVAVCPGHQTFRNGAEQQSRSPGHDGCRHQAHQYTRPAQDTLRRILQSRRGVHPPQAHGIYSARTRQKIGGDTKEEGKAAKNKGWEFSSQGAGRSQAIRDTDEEKHFDPDRNGEESPRLLPPFDFEALFIEES
ncbi:hypothetical protein FB451DRAFT_1367335 [Mycena latifolia]|nr:hypothetical protein FB451DRAFT_1367335 [Mycena latifolia]